MLKIFYITACCLLIELVYTQTTKEVTILHWNDFHARNEPYKISKKDTASGESKYYYVGGSASMLGYINKYRTPGTIVLNAGDDFQGTPLSNFTRGKSQIELLNLFSPDAFVLGNHEFDYSQLSLDTALQLAGFPVLSANVFLRSTNSLMAKPYLIKEVNGVKIGIIGITLPELHEVTLPSNVENVIMLNTDSVINQSIFELKEQYCDLIIMLTHCGADKDKELAEKYYKDIDIIVGGHSHIPLFRPKIVNGVYIVQAGSYARWLGKLDIKVDVTGDTVISAYGKLIETELDSSVFDLQASQKVNEMIAQYAPMLNQVIGNLATDWKSSYSEESNTGQFQAEVFRQRTGADIAFMNGGGLRKSMFKGDITIGDIWEISPFGNEIYIFNVSGKTLKQMIKNNIKIRLEKIQKGESAEMLNTAGLSYIYDSKKAAEGSEDFIVSINVNRAELSDDLVYKIAANSFIFTQFKKFFGEIDEITDGHSTGLIDRDLIIQAIEEAGSVNSVLEKRIIDAAK